MKNEKKILPPSPDLSTLRSVKVDEKTTIYVRKDITEEELAVRIARYNERKRSVTFNE
jgi:hypothetical protein